MVITITLPDGRRVTGTEFTFTAEGFKPFSLVQAFIESDPIFVGEEFADVMLSDAGVALAPGPIFGQHAEGFVRLCYANSIEYTNKAIEKMRPVLEKRMATRTVYTT